MRVRHGRYDPALRAWVITPDPIPPPEPWRSVAFIQPPPLPDDDQEDEL